MSKRRVKNVFLRCSGWTQSISDFLFDKEKYFVFSPWCSRIGHLFLEITIALSVVDRNKKKLVLIPHFKPVNKEIFNCQFGSVVDNRKNWRIFLLKNILVLSGILNWFYVRLLNQVRKYIPALIKFLPGIFYPRYGIEECDNLELYHLRGANFYYDWELILSQEWEISLNLEQYTRGNTIRKVLEIPEDGWFVCLHVRDQGFFGTDSQNYRNSSISNYIPAIRYITERGGYVVRMGDSNVTALPPLDHVIDYALSKYRSELMDIYLISQCRFFIGSDSGVYDIALLFQKPICSVNTTEFAAAFACLPHHVFLPKHLYSIEKRRILSLSEMITSDLYPFAFNDLSKYIFIENTPEEILETTKEYLLFVETNKFSSSAEKQEQVRSMRRQQHQYLLNQSFISDELKDTLLGTLHSQGRVGSFYLQNCLDKTPYLEKLSKLYN
jgi:putative glycosyltransferase (TIGR04372 family)